MLLHLRVEDSHIRLREGRLVYPVADGDDQWRLQAEKQAKAEGQGEAEEQECQKVKTKAGAGSMVRVVYQGIAQLAEKSINYSQFSGRW